MQRSGVRSSSSPPPIQKPGVSPGFLFARIARGGGLQPDHAQRARLLAGQQRPYHGGRQQGQAQQFVDHRRVRALAPRDLAAAGHPPLVEQALPRAGRGTPGPCARSRRGRCGCSAASTAPASKTACHGARRYPGRPSTCPWPCWPRSCRGCVRRRRCDAVRRRCLRHWRRRPLPRCVPPRWPAARGSAHRSGWSRHSE